MSNHKAFMLATSLMAPIASGLSTTISLDEGRAGVVALLTFLGFAVGIGIGINGPIQAASTAVRSQRSINRCGDDLLWRPPWALRSSSLLLPLSFKID